MFSRDLFENLKDFTNKPKPFEFYTAAQLWNDPYVSKKMLEAHLDPDLPASRSKEFINNSINWIIDHFKINKDSKICDFGCGPGFYTTPLALTGADITGIDFSERSIKHAKKVAEEKNLNYYT